MKNNKEKLEFIKRKLSFCTKCPALENPPILFESPEDGVKVFFVGRNPGYYEQQERRVMIGEAGAIFTRELKRIQCDREKVWVGNLASCYSLKDRCPTHEEFLNCFGYLKACIKVLKPVLVVTFGEAVARFLIPNIRWKYDRAKPKAMVVEGVKLVIFPIMHPAASVHKGKNSTKVAQDFNDVRQLLMKIDSKYWKIERW